MRHYLNVVATVLAVLLLAACGSQKKATEPKAHVVMQLDQNRAEAKRIQTKMQMALRTANHHFTVGGTLRMERDKVIQLSIMPFGLVEIGVIEFTPDYVLMMYRQGHKFMRARYKDVDIMAQNHIDFRVIQSLFWGELFTPGKSHCETNDFKMEQMGNTVILSCPMGKDMTVRFATSQNGGELKRTQVSKNNASGANLNWIYEDYMRVGRGELPSIFQASIDGMGGEVSSRFTLSNLKINPDWGRNIATVVDYERYQEVSIESLLTLLLNFN